MPQRRRHPERDQQERPVISVEAKTKVWIEQDGHFVMGDGGLYLLRAIRQRGSLTLAARDVGWSYRHAWEYIRRAERVLGMVLTGAVPGKESVISMPPPGSAQRSLSRRRCRRMRPSSSVTTADAATTRLLGLGASGSS